MSGFKMRRRVVLAMIESTYGTDANPTTSANAILCRTVRTTPLAGEDIDRNLIRAHFGNSEQVAGEKHVELELEVELAGSGTAGDAPAWGPLLRACGFAETEYAGVSVAYNPITGSEESITCYIHRDGVLHKFTGGRGTVRFDLSTNNIPYMTFRFMGLLGDISNTAIPQADTSAFQHPEPVTHANTSALSLHGADLSFQSLTIDLAVNTVKHQIVGQPTSHLITDRQPTGTAVVEEPALSTLNLYDKAKTAAQGAMAVTHGKTAGNIIEFTAPKVRSGSPTEQDQNGVQMLSLPLGIDPDTGNDELVITVK